MQARGAIGNNHITNTARVLRSSNSLSRLHPNPASPSSGSDYHTTNPSIYLSRTVTPAVPPAGPRLTRRPTLEARSRPAFQMAARSLDRPHPSCPDHLRRPPGLTKVNPSGVNIHRRRLLNLCVLTTRSPRKRRSKRLPRSVRVLPSAHPSASRGLAASPTNCRVLRAALYGRPDTSHSGPLLTASAGACRA
ncbi:hypothetical protein WJX74_009212 [Apatococcus lobatus]|uniref:Uncharacterized protein n=1 Tax=Apatococcus lobatus TaxID=904363 RepID=A0AAW1R141_9CHLO